MPDDLEAHRAIRDILFPEQPPRSSFPEPRSAGVPEPDRWLHVEKRRPAPLTG
jgi:hypothetical protein